jgi:hypothetical protein
MHMQSSRAGPKNAGGRLCLAIRQVDGFAARVTSRSLLAACAWLTRSQEEALSEGKTDKAIGSALPKDIHYFKMLAELMNHIRRVRASRSGIIDGRN